MRFHILGIPHTISTPEYSTCAFTQKVVKLCKLLTRAGHYVIHYGHQDSVVECAEHVTVIKPYDMHKTYGDYDWRKNGWVKFDENADWVYKAFNLRTPAEIEARKQPGDFLLCSFGFAHKPVADLFPGMFVVESGIGYPDGGYAPFRVFESYAILHAYQGKNAIAHPANDFWYDAVIPNYFDLADFEWSPVKDDYFLFLGRVNSGKGIHIAEQISNAVGTKLVVAGQGDFAFKPGSNIERAGVVGPAERTRLLARASAVICASTFLEPFCGVQVEAMLSGTPVISSDRGAFAEYNIQGKTGFRCRTFEQFEWAARNVGKIDPRDCRAQGEKFSLENVAPLYEDYFQSIKAIKDGGWYAKRPRRTSLL